MNLLENNKLLLLIYCLNFVELCFCCGRLGEGGAGCAARAAARAAARQRVAARSAAALAAVAVQVRLELL